MSTKWVQLHETPIVRMYLGLMRLQSALTQHAVVRDLRQLRTRVQAAVNAEKPRKPR